MHFPVHARVMTPTFRPQQWGLAEGELTTKQHGKLLEKEIKETAIRAAAATMALQVGLYWVPIVGQALGALISLVQYFTKKHYDAKVKNTIAGLKKQLEAKGKEGEARVKAVMDAVYAQEYPLAVALAASGAPLEGLGDFWSKAKDTVVKATKKAAPIVRQISSAPTWAVVVGSRYATSAALKTVAEGAKAVGAKGFAKDVRKFEEKGDDIAKDIQYRAQDPKRASDLLSGKELSRVAEERASKLKKQAFADIDKGTADAIAMIQSSAGRSVLRTQTAKALRQDPETLAKAQAYELEAHALRAQLNADSTAADAAIDSMVPTIPDTSKISSAPLLVGTGLAAVAAFLAFR